MRKIDHFTKNSCSPYWKYSR